MNHAPTDALYGQLQLPFSQEEIMWNSDIEVNDRQYRPYHDQAQDPYVNYLTHKWNLPFDGCPNCGGDLVGDGYTSVIHCEEVDPDPWLEPDANPVYCNYPDMEDSE